MIRKQNIALVIATALATATTASIAEGSRQPQYFAKITPFQLHKIDKWTAPQHAPESLRADVTTAAPELKKFLAYVSCKADHSSKAKSLPAAERTPYNDPGPMAELNSHEHRYTVCLTVDGIRNWTQPTHDAIAFEVVFRSADSLETVAKRYVAERQSGGDWRFSYAASPKK